jgi:hypothetical protein
MQPQSSVLRKKEHTAMTTTEIFIRTAHRLNATALMTKDEALREADALLAELQDTTQSRRIYEHTKRVREALR